jgi:hypothetical protein
MKRNLTIQLDEDLVRRAKMIAAERGTWSAAWSPSKSPS